VAEALLLHQYREPETATEHPVELARADSAVVLHAEMEQDPVEWAGSQMEAAQLVIQIQQVDSLLLS
jgi:hypothetical protein